MDQEFLVIDYTACKDNDYSKKVLFEIYGQEIFKYIDDAKKKNLKIAIYKVSECVLDWL